MARIMVGPVCDRSRPMPQRHDCKHESCYRIGWQAPWMIQMHLYTTPQR